jgi:hypothetical protein
MRSKIRRPAAIVSLIGLAGLIGAYAVSTNADALDYGAFPRAASAPNFAVGNVVPAPGPIVREDIRQLARQAMLDLISRHAAR